MDDASRLRGGTEQDMTLKKIVSGLFITSITSVIQYGIFPGHINAKFDTRKPKDFRDDDDFRDDNDFRDGDDFRNFHVHHHPINIFPRHMNALSQGRKSSHRYIIEKHFYDLKGGGIH